MCPKSPKRQIQILNGGRFISRRENAICYYDSHHKITKNDIGELVEELLPEPIVNNDWPKRAYRPRLESCAGNNGLSLIGFPIGRANALCNHTGEVDTSNNDKRTVRVVAKSPLATFHHTLGFRASFFIPGASINAELRMIARPVQDRNARDEEAPKEETNRVPARPEERVPVRCD
jgi:hypothetical protein